MPPPASRAVRDRADALEPAREDLPLPREGTI
jgi:hypothetical protein